MSQLSAQKQASKSNLESAQDIYSNRHEEKEQATPHRSFMERLVSQTPAMEEKNYFMNNFVQVQQANRPEASFGLGFRASEVEQAYKNTVEPTAVGSGMSSLQGSMSSA